MGLVFLPFFMPLFLLGWVLPSEDERALQALEAEQERQIGETWAVLFCRESQVMDRGALAAFEDPGQRY